MNEKPSAQERLKNAPLTRLMISLSIPTVAAQLVNLIYNMVDRLYVARLPEVGSLAIAGLGISLPIFAIVYAFANLAGQGGAPRASIALGRGEPDEAERIFGNSLFFLLAFGISLSLIVLLFKKPLLTLFGATEDFMPYATQYLSIYAIGITFVLITMGLNAFITAQGYSNIAMRTVLIGAVTNIILDPILIYALNMGVAGAALATVISQGFSALFVISFFFGNKTKIHIKRKNLTPDPKVFLPMMALGIAPFIMSSTESGVQIAFNTGLSIYGGSNYVSSMTILFTLGQLIFIPISGITQGCTSIVSYNYGAGNKERALSALKRMITVSALFSLVLGGMFIIFPEPFVKIFTPDPAIIEITCKAARIFFVGYAAFGAQPAIQSIFISLGEAKISLFIATLRKIILLIPLALILPRIGLGTTGIYLAEAISDVISVTVATCLLAFNIQRLLNRDPKTV